MWVGIIQSPECPTRTKRRREDRFPLSLFELGHPSSVLRHWSSWFSGLWAQAELYPPAFLVLQLTHGILTKKLISQTPHSHEPIPIINLLIYLHAVDPWIRPGLGAPTCTVENARITSHMALCIHGSASTDSTNRRSCSTEVWIYF